MDVHESVRAQKKSFQRKVRNGKVEEIPIRQRQFVPGVIRGIHLNVEQMGADEDGFEDEDYTPIKENSCFGICEEYYVDVDNDLYWGDGTYQVNKIKPIKK